MKYINNTLPNNKEFNIDEVRKIYGKLKLR